MECFSNELISTADKALYDLRATAHSAKQTCGQRFQAFAAKVRGLTTDCNYLLECPHAAAAAQACAAIPGCNFTSEVIKDILLAGIYDLDVRREVLGTAGIENTSMNDLVRVVEAKEAARDAAGCIRPAATAAAASFKKPGRQGRATK